MIFPPPPIDTTVATVTTVAKVTTAEVDRALHWPYRRRLTILRRLADAAASGSIKRARELTMLFLHSSDAKLIAARRALPPYAPLQEIQKLARHLDCFAPSQEPIAWRLVPKRSRGFRIVCIPPPRLKAVHYLIKDVLAAQFEPPEHIYDWKRRGRDRYTIDVLVEGT